MLKRDRVHRPWSLDDIFAEGQWCPVCKGKEFTYVEGMGIYCDECGAEFALRYTGGDPGVVVDCKPSKWTYYKIRRQTWTKKDRPLFWQVLKECDRGLDGRGIWCTNLDLSDLGEHRYLYLRIDDPPMGEAQEYPVEIMSKKVPCEEES